MADVMLNAGPSRERRMTEDSLGETVNAVNGIKEDTLMFKVAKQLDSSFLELEKSLLELIQKSQKGGKEQDTAGLRVKCKRRIETVDEICDRMRKHVERKYDVAVCQDWLKHYDMEGDNPQELVQNAAKYMCKLRSSVLEVFNHENPEVTQHGNGSVSVSGEKKDNDPGNTKS